jgi:transposase
MGLVRAHALIQAFPTMVRERRSDHLEAWIAEATHSDIGALARYARGLQNNLIAVKAGLTLEWSHGVTEGQIHRLARSMVRSFTRIPTAFKLFTTASAVTK